MAFSRTTETESNHQGLDNKSIEEVLYGINQEDQTVPQAINKIIPQIESLVSKAVEQLEKGGRLFYIGAGTSGRLGIVDASECPPTFGVPQGMVVGLMAGGDSAMRKAVEFAEDDKELGWNDLQKEFLSSLFEHILHIHKQKNLHNLFTVTLQ